MKSFLRSMLFVAVVISASSCKDDDETPEIPNEQEVITTLRYILTPVDSGSTVVLDFRDLDGDGGNAPVISTPPLAANRTYTGQIILLNELESPVDTVSNEVSSEALDHQFFFSESANYDITYDDLDSDGNPIGLISTLVSNAAGNAPLQITLRHEPNKTGAGVSSGDITNAGGETDIDVTFNIQIQ